MDVFKIRDRLIHEYREYVGGFVAVKQEDAHKYVEEYFGSGRLWPEPLVQLNPAFEAGRWVDELVKLGALHPECETIFKRRDYPGDLGHRIRLHQHQDEGIQAAATGKSYVLTTGTGSGKSLAYFVPIVDYVLRAGPGRGIKAIVVYPMNALCNSQEEALERFLKWGYPGGNGPVRFARYTGQESTERRKEIIASPPDILLTNYVMLELILTRTDLEINERKLVEASQGLEFLVLDELHTYRGRQGADVAMLVRRVRERCGAPSMRCVGTSATIAGAATREERQREVARVASQLFGLEVPAENVIGETLERATRGQEPSAADLAAVLERPPDYPADHATLVGHPLAVWAEGALGLREDSQRRLERRPARTLTDAARELSERTGAPEGRCSEHLQALLLAGSRAHDPESGFPLFAFRLHQFISKGDTIYATPEPPGVRQLSAEGQTFVSGDRSKRFFPLAFCRLCGQDYLAVALEGGEQLTSWEPDLRSEDPNVEPGYVVLQGPSIRDPIDGPEGLALLPEEWTELRRETLVIRSSAREFVPRPIRVDPSGRVLGRDEPGGEAAWFMKAPFRFCFGCGVTYASAREKEFSRVAGLSSEGRSTATTILSIATVVALREDGTLPRGASHHLLADQPGLDAARQQGASRLHAGYGAGPLGEEQPGAGRLRRASGPAGWARPRGAGDPVCGGSPQRPAVPDRGATGPTGSAQPAVRPEARHRGLLPARIGGARLRGPVN